MNKITILSNGEFNRGWDLKNFESDRRTLSGIEVVRMIKKNQLISQDKTVFKSFMSLAA